MLSALKTLNHNKSQTQQIQAMALLDQCLYTKGEKSLIKTRGCLAAASGVFPPYPLHMLSVPGFDTAPVTGKDCLRSHFVWFFTNDCDHWQPSLPFFPPIVVLCLAELLSPSGFVCAPVSVYLSAEYIATLETTNIEMLLCKLCLNTSSEICDLLQEKGPLGIFHHCWVFSIDIM